MTPRRGASVHFLFLIEAPHTGPKVARTIPIQKGAPLRTGEVLSGGGNATEIKTPNETTKTTNEDYENYNITGHSSPNDDQSDPLSYSRFRLSEPNAQTVHTPRVLAQLCGPLDCCPACRFGLRPDLADGG